MPREDLVLFLDLETTGSDKEHDEIIEIGISALDMTKDGYPERASFTSIIVPSDAAFLRMMNKKVVREMHTKNGLLDEIVAERDKEAAGLPTWYTKRRIAAELDKFVHSLVADDNTHIPFGGSGVSHFDRPFLDKHYPWFTSRLTFWAHDVGPIRRAFVKAGGTGWPNQEIDDQGKSHRALDDARFHADEWRFALKVFGQ